MTRTRPPYSPRDRQLRVRTLLLACLVSSAVAFGAGSIGAGAETVPALHRTAPSATAWTASVHAAFARQAGHMVDAARAAFTQTGLASWYGHEFSGRRTSSGARFDPMRLTCAHRTLPLGTRLLVTSQETGRSVVVTVNDRGPYAGPDRIIDLSSAAATRLGMVKTGLNAVIVQRVVPADTAVEVAQAADADTSAQAVTASRSH